MLARLCLRPGGGGARAELAPLLGLRGDVTALDQALCLRGWQNYLQAGLALAGNARELQDRSQRGLPAGDRPAQDQHAAVRPPGRLRSVQHLDLHAAALADLPQPKALLPDHHVGELGGQQKPRRGRSPMHNRGIAGGGRHGADEVEDVPFSPQDAVQPALDNAGPLALDLPPQKVDACARLLADLLQAEALLANDHAGSLCADKHHDFERRMSFRRGGPIHEAVKQLLRSCAFAVSAEHNDAKASILPLGGHMDFAACCRRNLLESLGALGQPSARYGVRNHHVYLHEVGLRTWRMDLAPRHDCINICGSRGTMLTWRVHLPLQLRGSHTRGIRSFVEALPGTRIQGRHWRSRRGRPRHHQQVQRPEKVFRARRHLRAPAPRGKAWARRLLRRARPLPLAGPPAAAVVHSPLQPLVGTHLLRGWPVRRRQAQEPPHHRLCCLADLELRNSPVDLRLLIADALEGEVPGEQDIEQDTEAPEVRAEVVGPRAEDLGGDVGVRAHRREGLAESNTDGLGKAEVRDLHVIQHQGLFPALGGDQDIL
mmetsp:Transcript_61587/g.190741  ORF Transcript_61587/g.190741 Transcript_61587/m.190741 type:complete len:543 (+) Transcript_61587:277-1905(+)